MTWCILTVLALSGCGPDTPTRPRPQGDPRPTGVTVPVDVTVNFQGPRWVTMHWFINREPSAPVEMHGDQFGGSHTEHLRLAPGTVVAVDGVPHPDMPNGFIQCVVSVFSKPIAYEHKQGGSCHAGTVVPGR